jgi:asparagine synthase (glutamine-hydrolysing)
MERVLAFCGKRQIVLPLSGGLDSRLVAGLLKRLGRENVFCFAYGLPGNRELAKSREAAETLGYSWRHVPYDLEGIRRALFSEEAHRYKAMAFGGVSLPFIDDWPALWLLKHQGMVDDDAVFLTGQTGDFICGSHLKYLLDPEWHGDPLDVTGAIIGKNFANWFDLLEVPEVRERIVARIGREAGDFPLDTAEGRAAFYEYWECQERQVKYVVNGARGYEFFGYGWAYPLWDRELMDFWKRPSISLKMDRYLYRRYLAEFDPFRLFQSDRRQERWTREWALNRMAGRRVSWAKRCATALASVPGLGALARAYRQHKQHKHFLRHNPLGYPLGYGKFRYTWRELSKRHHLVLMFRDFFCRQYGLDCYKTLAG